MSIVDWYQNQLQLPSHVSEFDPILALRNSASPAAHLPLHCFLLHSPNHAKTWGLTRVHCPSSTSSKNGTAPPDKYIQITTHPTLHHHHTNPSAPLEYLSTLKNILVRISQDDYQGLVRCRVCRRGYRQGHEGCCEKWWCSPSP